ncbi:MAG: hypothetical protein J2P45_17110, partial [Candidatus Dormibacteraeota bacterium]|nr:hypothetical protein [Candidatus Dormibacteraeota bacterium]
GESEAHGPRLTNATEAGWAGFLRLWAGIPTLRAIILSELFLFWVLGALAIFLPLLIHRRYGLGVAGSATVGGGILIAGGLIGTFLGGWLGDWRSRRVAGGHLQVGLVGFVLGAVFVILALLSSGLLLFVIFGLLAAISLYLYSAPFTALIQNVVSPSMRASAITLSLVVAHLFGDAWSPTAVGALSDAMHSLPLALGLTCPPVLIGAAVLAARGIRSAQRDVAAMEEAWARHPAESTAPA